jgi:hypothetical protein
MSIDQIEDVELLYGIPKQPRQKAVTLKPIYGLLPSRAVRNPITTSATSQKVVLPYKTAATGHQIEIGLCESLAEAAVGEEAIISTDVYDVEFQPITFPYEYPAGRKRNHTMDLRITYHDGTRRMVFVRNEMSLSKPWTWEEIDAIHEAIPNCEAEEFVVVNADAYSRARRDNLNRMHRLVAFQPDPESDLIVEKVATNLKSLWLMSDLAKHLDLPKWRVWQSCQRLIAAGVLGADMDAVICHHSRIWRIEAC